MTDQVRRIPDDEVDGDEGWARLTDEPDVRDVEVVRHGDQRFAWSVTVAAMEFVCEEPLESSVRRAIAAALGEVTGVAAVGEDDREIWVVDGTPDGEALAIAVAGALDEHASAIRRLIGEL